MKKLKTVLELYDLEIHQKKLLGRDCRRLKTTVQRSIEQDIRNKNFGARNGNYERNAVVKNQVTKQREQRTLGYCWQWEFNGQCSRGDKCSFPTISISVEKLHHQIRLRILSCSRMKEFGGVIDGVIFPRRTSSGRASSEIPEWLQEFRENFGG